MTPEERFFAKVDKTETCWLWTGCINHRTGYGEFWYDGRVQTAHRASHLMFVGPIPKGLVVDHVLKRGCVHRHCVNPAHLEAVTYSENSKRGNVGGSTRQPYCRQGHLYDEANTYIAPGTGWAQCRICNRERSLRNYHRRKANA